MQSKTGMILKINQESKNMFLADLAKHIYEEILYKRTKPKTFNLEIIRTYSDFSFLQNILPVVLNDIIIEYINESFDVGVALFIISSSMCMLVVQCDILKLNHKYYLLIDDFIKEGYIYVSDIVINQIISNISHFNFYLINYYMIHNHPNKEKLKLILWKSMIDYNQKKKVDGVIDNIINREEFDNEIIIIIELFNSLQGM